MEQHKLDCEEIEIDLRMFFELLTRRKKAFVVVFLLCVLAGTPKIFFVPDTYKTIIKAQPPASGELSPGEKEIASIESLKGLIVNNVFNDRLKLKLGISDTTPIKFDVVIPSGTEILQISTQRKSQDKISGAVLLQELCGLISESYAKQIESKANNYLLRIKQREKSIQDAEEGIKITQEQITKLTSRMQSLEQEAEGLNENTKEIMAMRDKMLPQENTLEKAMLFTNLIQTNVSYLNQLNNQKNDIYFRRDALGIHIRNINVEIDNLANEIEEIKEKKNLISNLKVLSDPKVAGFSGFNDKAKKFVLLLVFGSLFSVFIIFLQELWVKARG